MGKRRSQEPNQETNLSQAGMPHKVHIGRMRPEQGSTVPYVTSWQAVVALTGAPGGDRMRRRSGRSETARKFSAARDKLLSVAARAGPGAGPNDSKKSGVVAREHGNAARPRTADRAPV
ncbi:hypothetical protein GGX14DRAFT_405034 [Mycena pura]|uniref:Uncharacterized protein n=1 Tax=Mycena pura TaxID=153505 RepID=A0AAD6UT61_9AGAR|nr:hypothetical protein GGX14DRAFT_405034 [Mycena pura]